MGGDLIAVLPTGADDLARVAVLDKVFKPGSSSVGVLWNDLSSRGRPVLSPGPMLCDLNRRVGGETN